MNSKLLGLSLLFTFTLASTGQCDCRTIVLSTTNTNFPPTTNFVVGASQVVEFMWASGFVQGGASVGDLLKVEAAFPLSPSDTNFSSVVDVSPAIGAGPRMPWPALIRGPVKVTLTMNGFLSPESVAFCTFRITDQNDAFTPSNAVVIPADAQAPVAIVVESSTNLVDWVDAMPGTYGQSSQQRHFRIRAVRQ